MLEPQLIMNPFRLKEARPDLWPEFLNILKVDAPDYYEMFINDDFVTQAIASFGARITVKVNNLPPRAQDLIHKAMKEAQQRMNNDEK